MNRFLSLFIFTLVSFHLMAANNGSGLETGWLKPVEGSQGKKIGAEVKAVSTDVDGGAIIEIEMPVDNLAQYDVIEVIEKGSSRELIQSQPFSLTDSYDNDSYGMRLHLKRFPKLEFRLRLIDSDALENE